MFSLHSRPCCVAPDVLSTRQEVRKINLVFSKFPDDCCCGVSCNHNKGHKDQSSHSIGSGWEMSVGVATGSSRAQVSAPGVPNQWHHYQAKTGTKGYPFFFFLIYPFNFWLHWVFAATRGLSLVAVSGGHSSSRGTSPALWWPLLLQSTGSRHVGFSSCVTRASVVVACGL